MDKQAVEKAAMAAGRKIFNLAKAHETHVWESIWWERQAIKWMASDQELKSRAMRFIDVFPSLNSNEEIAQHIREYLPAESFRLPEYLHLGQTAVRSALKTPRAVALGSHAAINRIARWFIAGSGPEEIVPVLQDMAAKKFGYTLDLLGEATLSEREADVYTEKYLALIEKLAGAFGQGGPEINVSVKLSSLSPHFDPGAPEESSRAVRERLRLIFRAAMKNNAWVNIDMENYVLRDLTLKVFRDILEEEEFKTFGRAGIVAQAYLKDAQRSLEDLLAWVVANNRNISIRLVKGAYWEQEMVMASQKKWAVPVFTDKAATDEAFERMAKTLLENHKHVVTAIASHNIRSLAWCVALAGTMGVPKERLEVQMLYGMAEEVKSALVAMDVPMRVYTPFGEFLPGMAYLVRRILENSSNDSFLRQSFIEDKPVEELLANPEDLNKAKDEQAKEEEEKEEEKEKEDTQQPQARIFVNEPEPEFHTPRERSAMDKAIHNVFQQASRRHKIIIDGELRPAERTFMSVDPGDPERVVGEVCLADQDTAIEAMDSASRAFTVWGGFKPERRAQVLLDAAGIIRSMKHELAAWQIMEVGKTRGEALADVNEAIDLISYYAITSEKLFNPSRTDTILGEENTSRLIPRGPGVVIAPWNFPLAILAGLTTSALAAGNTVVIKPSSQAPVMASLFAEILLEAGLPDGAANYLPGLGSEIGNALVEHPAASFISFTGSYQVGSDLVKSAAAATASRDGFIKVVAEMGGKNAVIVDSTADLDAAVAGVIHSAFGFGGQKCSACSRVIVLDGVYEEFAGRLVDAAASLMVGQASSPDTNYGPLVEKAAVEKVAEYVEIGRKEAATLLAPGPVPKEGYFAAPAIFGDVPVESRIAQDEIFGPVLSLIRVKSLGEAIEAANNVKYALTGGVYSRTPSSIRKVTDSLRVGNLYINRGITGAVVRRQPFGGFKRSGLGSAKAGGEDIIRELALPQSISENIVRHGFSPDLPT